MNWKTLITELVSAGVSQAEISRKIGIKASTLNEHFRSSTLVDMRWSSGDKLIKLHKKVLKKKV